MIFQPFGEKSYQNTEENIKYMETKRERMGHILEPMEDVGGDGSDD